MIINRWKIGIISLFMAVTAQAGTVTTLNFADLNTALSGNTVNVDGSTADLEVTGVATNNDYLYSVTYTGADFDGDSVNDMLTFDVLVEGFSGTVVSNAGIGTSSATIGSTDEDVIISDQKWYVGNNRMNSGETLKFTVVSVGSSVGSVAFDGFDSVTAIEGASYGHEAVIGEGTGLNGYSFNDNLTMVVSPAESPLYVTSATANDTKAQWGVGDIDFGLTVTATSGPIPTLSTTAGRTVSGKFTVDIDFTETVTGLAESDISVVNGTVQASSLTGSGENWSVVIIPTANGDVSVTLPADSVIDVDSEPNPESNTLVTTYVSPGSDQPIATLSTPLAEVDAPYTVQIDFTEAVTGLELSDFVISNGTLSNLAGSGVSYSVLVTPISAGDVTLSLPGNSVTDTDGDNLQNPASNELDTIVTGVITVVDWNGTVDGSWCEPGNWSTGLVPGDATGDLVVLSGSNDTPVLPAVVETTNSCSIEVRGEASLEVCDGVLLCDYISLGSASGMGGGHMKMWSSADVDVSGDLRVGDNAGATSVSTLQLMQGSLAVDGELYVGNGLLEIDGSDMTVDVDDCMLTSNATLRFDFDLTPVTILEVADHFSIASGAKLEIDLRGYNTGGNELELVRFGSVSGSFNPANITITGLGGGVVTMDGDSLNLTVIDDVAARSCNLWFVATGGTGTDPLDLQVNTGRRIRNLSSPNMSYSLTVNGNEKVYSTSWSGSDFDGDGVNDSVSFDLRVEGFSGSTYTYNDNSGNASMTALGGPAVVKGDSEGWGVGADGDLDAGETLRFSVENLSLSTSGGVMEGFVAVDLVEPSGGSNHILIFGEGQDLQSQKSSFATGIGFSPELPLVVTSAASTNVAVNNVAFKLHVSELPDFLDTETGDYSHYPTGPQHRTEYAPASNIDYPDWSWESLQMSAGVHRNDELPNNVANLMANTYPVISLGGRNFYGEDYVEDGLAAAAAKLKSFNPNVHVTCYRNAGLHHDRMRENKNYNRDWSIYSLDSNGNRVYDVIRLWDRYNHDHPDFRKWWTDWCVARLADENIDSLFIDKATGGAEALLNDDGEIEARSNRVKSYVNIRERMPVGSVLTGNILRTSYFGGNRELLHVFNSAYSEGWKGGNGDSLIPMSRADGICASLQMFREAAVKGMMVNPNHAELNHFILSGDEAEAMIDEGRGDEVIDLIRQEIQLALAYYLIFVERYSYFSFQVQTTGEFGDKEFLWNPKPYIDEFKNPLGEPLGPPVKNGYIFTRSFEHVDVRLDVETEECRLTWDWMPVADAQTVNAAKNNSRAIMLTGSNLRRSGLTYVVFTGPAHGTLSGTAPNLVYSPDSNFAGEDSFTFKTVNDMAKSLKATVSIVVK